MLNTIEFDMKLLKHEEFEREYPGLYLFSCLMTEEAIEKANTELYKKRAEACDYYSMIKLLFYDKSAKDLQIVKDKSAAILTKVRNGDVEAEVILRQIVRASKGLNPFPGHKEELPEPNVLMREYANIVMELQKLQHLPPDKDRPYVKKIFNNKDSKFYEQVKKIFGDSFQNDPEYNYKPEEIVGDVENNIQRGIIMPFEFAYEVLSKKFNAKEDTIRRKFKKGFLPILRSRFKDKLNPIDLQFVDGFLNY